MSNKLSPNVKLGRCNKCDALSTENISGGFNIKLPSAKVTSLYPSKRKTGSTKVVSLF